jgi:hypothetical protein
LLEQGFFQDERTERRLCVGNVLLALSFFLKQGRIPGGKLILERFHLSLTLPVTITGFDESQGGFIDGHGSVLLDTTGHRPSGETTRPGRSSNIA